MFNALTTLRLHWFRMKVTLDPQNNIQESTWSQGASFLIHTMDMPVQALPQEWWGIKKMIRREVGGWFRIAWDGPKAQWFTRRTQRMQKLLSSLIYHSKRRQIKVSKARVHRMESKRNKRKCPGICLLWVVPAVPSDSVGEALPLWEAHLNPGIQDSPRISYVGVQHPRDWPQLLWFQVLRTSTNIHPPQITSVSKNYMVKLAV